MSDTTLFTTKVVAGVAAGAAPENDVIAGRGRMRRLGATMRSR
ncbi:hypothetical protein [Gryllotalpicola ginsengisoli]|nr:hypothetical protein [Gryllotalpicola ginsengisoli]